MTSEVFNTDCLKYMRTLPDKAFQLAIADPPYGDANSDVGGGKRFGERFDRYKQSEPCGGGRFERYNRIADGRHMGGEVRKKIVSWDEAPQQIFFDELLRVSEAVIIWGGNYFSLPPSRCFLVWEKTNIPENFTMAMCEYAWTSMSGNAKVFKGTSLRNEHSGKFHPTEKPIELYAWCLRLFAKPGDRIFDPMMGSQSSRIAAYKMGFDYVGCELDKEYFDKGCERFNRECKGEIVTAGGHIVKQTSLFDL